MRLRTNHPQKLLNAFEKEDREEIEELNNHIEWVKERCGFYVFNKEKKLFWKEHLDDCIANKQQLLDDYEANYGKTYS